MDYACKGDNILISTNLSRAWSQRDRPDIYSIILFICHLMLAVCPPLRAHSHAARSAALHCWAPRQSGRPRRVILRTCCAQSSLPVPNLELHDGIAWRSLCQRKSTKRNIRKDFVCLARRNPRQSEMTSLILAQNER